MHGRVRHVITDEERIKKKKKLEQYSKLRNCVFEKIKSGKFNEEAMQMSAALLLKNADFVTIWNCRRQFLLSLPKGDELEKHFQEELNLTKDCLYDNPKSYCVWFHRSWVLGHQSYPNFEKEFLLINEALKFDDRNFHCWDYRRFVCKLSKRNIEEELAYSETKVNEDFSNYSAWHYRSELLPQLYPPNDISLSQYPIAVEKLLEEISLVDNGIFTDPDDQTCWFYRNWLAGKREPPLTLLRVYVDFKLQIVSLCFSTAVELDEFNIALEFEKNCIVDFCWKSSDNSASTRVWYSQLDCQFCPKFKGTVNFIKAGKLQEFDSTISIYGDEIIVWQNDKTIASLNSKIDERVKESLLQCRKQYETLASMEQENHWPVVACVGITDILQDDSKHLKTFENISHLMKVDSKRISMYRYWKSKIFIESKSVCEISDLKSCDLYYLGNGFDFHKVVSLDICNNMIISLLPLQYAIHLRELYASGNQICSLKGIENLLGLVYITVKNNSINESIKLSNLKYLKMINISANPICLCFNAVKFNEEFDTTATIVYDEL
ncbi:Geranylgeranyl transferase type-2 subunit alpha [Trichinella pseudospiralis]|uniref:Geranylgeranyl transferase type-2 subunit alpha n=1 Tax=Trichinella pseudospiralis TaxID=6337 RepID=A0A0V1J4Q3_TRIPS|nr:Geranylgeranyl transferase type-2 subunit alpha [Trichinella pseudospiralis]KRY67645.1 Geranylgeranyl transferase type-2 subunit alpha [Trichinella pseudospiralis]KRZ23817.1 Geranylgeranyl transferase type-2 subunit alpha [Trichinella pseudospiralis]KRZ29952.1 Geranylgeranyl transferase type-2 subunit alpha [Trichinella pseudospiralis]